MYLAIIVQICILYIIQSFGEVNTRSSGTCYSAGIPGIPGNHGNPGSVGSPGERGIPGEKGEKGAKGKSGKDCVACNRGQMGEKGDRGDPGERGESLRGETGMDGRKGAKGDKGASPYSKHSAFSVSFTTDPGRHPIGPMKYDTVITNIGNDYNTKTGKFLCEYPGTYVFQVSGLKSTGNGKSVLTKIMKNNEGTVSSRMEGAGYSSSSNMVVLNLVAGDEVWTEPHSTNYNYYYSSVHAYCSFSGFLIYASS